MNVNRLIVPVGILIIILLVWGGYVLLNSHQGKPPEDNNPGITSNPPPEEANKPAGEKVNTNVTPPKDEAGKNNDTDISLNSLNETNPSSNSLERSNEELYDENETNGRVEPSSWSPKLTVYRDKLEKNAKTSFKVGEKYLYNLTFYSIEGNKKFTNNDLLEFAVEKTEPVDGKESYVIRKSLREILSEENKETLRRMGESEERIKQREMMNYRETNYYDKETGKIMQITGIGGEIFKKTDAEGRSIWDFYDIIMFSDWMLALNDNFTWKQRIDIDEGRGASTQTFKYKVNGREKVNARECFKVEINLTAGRENITINKTMWVDVNERIMVKLFTKTIPSPGFEDVAEVKLIDE